MLQLHPPVERDLTHIDRYNPSPHHPHHSYNETHSRSLHPHSHSQSLCLERPLHYCHDPKIPGSCSPLSCQAMPQASQSITPQSHIDQCNLSLHPHLNEIHSSSPHPHSHSQ